MKKGKGKACGEKKKGKREINERALTDDEKGGRESLW